MKILKFGAEKCPGCKVVEAYLPSVAERLGFELEEISTDTHRDLAVDTYKVRNLPCVILLDDSGTEITRAVGVKTPDEYVTLFSSGK